MSDFAYYLNQTATSLFFLGILDSKLLCGSFLLLSLLLSLFSGEMTDLIAEVSDRNRVDESSGVEMQRRLVELEHHLCQSEAEADRLKTALKGKEEEAEQLKASNIVRRV